MIRKNKYSIAAIACFYCLYFIFFLAIIQHPSVHYLSADLNYSNISDYAEAVNLGDPHSECVNHIHEGDQEDGHYCIVCKYFQHTYQSESPSDFSQKITYTATEYVQYISLLKSPSNLVLPALRAPPLA